MPTKATAELERSASTDEQPGFDARDALTGRLNDTTVRQAVLAGKVDL